MKITEKQLRRIIRESIKTVLSEAALDREFHYTELKNLVSIIRKNIIELNGTEYDDDMYSLSMTRSRTNTHGYQYGVYGADEKNRMPATEQNENYARIEFDGRKLNNIRNAKTRPYDFYYITDLQDYNPEFAVTGKERHIATFETGESPENLDDPESIKRQFWAQSEDRLESKNNYIPDARKYISRIDVMIRDKNDKNLNDLMYLINTRPQWKDIIFLHTENKTFNRPAAEEE